MDVELLKKLWKSRCTILEVLEARGFAIPPEDHLELDEFIEWAGEDDEKTIRNALTLTYFKKEEKIVVYWPIEPNLGSNVKWIYNEMVNLGIKRVIIVINTKVTSQSNNFIRAIARLGYILDIFTLAETQFNISKHRLVPIHIICSIQEKKKVLADYSITTQQLPYIKSSDVMVRHLGARKGQLIKIIRDSETQLGYKTISYRIVV